jgi:2-succinyl-5-enolpyruvyl-6-hydroxy-3-cyclohexene-1-carboxylate synthase
MATEILPPCAFSAKDDYLAQFPSADAQTAPATSALTPDQKAQADQAIASMLAQEAFRHKFRAARLARGLTQAQAALIISPSLSVRTVDGWELAGKSSPPAWTHAFIFGQLRRD